MIVMKFGGTSVADPERLKRVAGRVAHTRAAGNDVIVVVSAMGGSTDDMITLAHHVSDDPPAREMDMLLTAGERISVDAKLSDVLPRRVGNVEVLLVQAQAQTVGHLEIFG